MRRMVCVAVVCLLLAPTGSSWGMGSSDEIQVAVGNLVCVRFLDRSWTGVTDAGVKYVADLPNFRTLYLANLRGGFAFQESDPNAQRAAARSSSSASLMPVVAQSGAASRYGFWNRRNLLLLCAIATAAVSLGFVVRLIRDTVR